jgi:enoyl-CoA hydratase/carnithine racemase
VKDTNESCCSDIIVASPEAQFGLPEVAVGLYAAAGGLPRLMRIVGLQLASEIAMTGRRLSAQEALDYRLINRISKSPRSVVEECIEMAVRITSFSPDGIIVTRQGLREAWDNPSVEHATTRTRHEYVNKLVAGDNFKIGVEAFAMKKKPKWVPSRL